MNKKTASNQTLIICLLILIAAAGRLITNHFQLWNFAPIAAMGLFSGANFKRKINAFIVPVAAMLLTDLVLGLHRGMLVIYLTFALITCIGFWLKNHNKTINIIFASLLSSTIFFLVTNFGVWVMDGLYPQNFNGLVQCFVAAIPFYGNPDNAQFTINSFAGDLFYCGFLFGGYALVKRFYPKSILS